MQTSKETHLSDLPSVSVVVVNLNGRALLRECLDSLAAQEFPPAQVEVILVDNGSTDDSVPFVQRSFPWVRVVRAGRNLGFAGGSNLGASVTTGEYLALLNNDARADPGWLAAQVRALAVDRQVACAASKVLDQDGETIDFVGTAMNLYGRAFQVDEGLPSVPGKYDDPCELLAPCGAAMMIRRDLFWEVGGFDEDFIAYYEDVDLGWRLWLYGYKILFVPEAIAYHRKHQTGASFPVEQRYTLSEINALRMQIKNLEEENLWRVLPFSLFMGVKRSVEQAGLTRESYQLGVPAHGDPQAGIWQPERRMTRVATSFLIAIDQVGEEMPRLLEKRRRIQAARVRSDEEIFSRFPIESGNPIFPWRRYHVVQDNLAKSLGVPNTMLPRHGSRLLIITHESIGPRMAGPGIRAWEMACALSERFEVTLAAPGAPVRSHNRVRLIGYEADDPRYASLRSSIAHADVVLTMGSLLAKMPPLQDLGKPTIVDLYDPFELEKLSQSPHVEERYHANIDLESTRHLSVQAAAGDFFICASERQRDFWLGVLLAHGRINTRTYAQDSTLRALIDVVPYGMPAELPRRQKAVLKGVHPRIGRDDKLLFWNGGLWQWFDPFTLLDALAITLRSRDDVKLYFAAGRHFDSHIVPEMPIYDQVTDRCRELGLLDEYVFFGDWIPYDERGDYLLEADLGVSTHQDTLESRFASRSRILDCIWAGLPVILTAGDPLSAMIAKHGLGRTVPPGQPEALAQSILDMLGDDDLHRRVNERADKVHGELAWSQSVKPIAGFLERAAFAPDALAASRRLATQRRVEELESRLEKIHQHWIMRSLRAIRVVLGRE